MIPATKIPDPLDAFTEGDALTALTALGQQTRLAVFRHLVVHEPVGDCPGEIAAALDLSAATLSFHLKALQSAGLLSAQAQGRHIVYRARLDTVGALVAFLGENCCGSRGTRCVPFQAPAMRRVPA